MATFCLFSSSLPPRSPFSFLPSSPSPPLLLLSSSLLISFSSPTSPSPLPRLIQSPKTASSRIIASMPKVKATTAPSKKPGKPNTDTTNTPLRSPSLPPKGYIVAGRVLLPAPALKSTSLWHHAQSGVAWKTQTSPVSAGSLFRNGNSNMGTSATHPQLSLSFLLSFLQHPSRLPRKRCQPITRS